MTDTPTNRRSWLRPRFSLRVLLLAVTAFAIGFPLWYRWPYEEVTETGIRGQRIITTWQRQWGGGRLKHGVTRYMIGQLTGTITTYRNGKKDGPCRVYSFKGAHAVPRIVGQFVDDQMDGVWTEIIDSRGQKQVTTYDHGKQVSP